VRLNSSAIAEISVQRLCAFKSACLSQDVDQGAGVDMAGRFKRQGGSWPEWRCADGVFSLFLRQRQVLNFPGWVPLCSLLTSLFFFDSVPGLTSPMPVMTQRPNISFKPTPLRGAA